MILAIIITICICIWGVVDRICEYKERKVKTEKK